MAPSQVSISAHVLSVLDRKRICVRLDKSHVECISNIITNAYEQTVVKDTIIINVSACRIDLSFSWSELSDLIGVHIRADVAPRRYSYWRTNQITDSEGIQHVTTSKRRGVTFHARSIRNIEL